jgi:hypothetical protein
MLMRSDPFREFDRLTEAINDARYQPGSHGMPGRMAVPPPETSGALVLDTDVAERRCWRCLQMFPGDSTRAPTPTPQWWLCDPCDRVLLAPTQRAA